MHSTVCCRCSLNWCRATSCSMAQTSTYEGRNLHCRTRVHAVVYRQADSVITCGAYDCVTWLNKSMHVSVCSRLSMHERSTDQTGSSSIQYACFPITWSSTCRTGAQSCSCICSHGFDDSVCQRYTFMYSGFHTLLTLSTVLCAPPFFRLVCSCYDFVHHHWFHQHIPAGELARLWYRSVLSFASMPMTRTTTTTIISTTSIITTTSTPTSTTLLLLTLLLLLLLTLLLPLPLPPLLPLLLLLLLLVLPVLSSYEEIFKEGSLRSSS